MKLSEVFKKDKLIKIKEMQIQDLVNTSLRSPILNPDKVQTSTTNTTEERNLKIAEIGREIKEELEDLIKAKKELAKAIDRVEDDTEKAVLNLRYVQLLKWEDISKVLYYSEKHLFKIHKRAKSSYYAKLDTK